MSHVNLGNDLAYTTSPLNLKSHLFFSSLNRNVHFLQRFGGTGSTGGTAVSYDSSESSQPGVPAQDKEEWEVGENSELEG